MTVTEFLLARIDEDETAASDTRWLAFEYGVDSTGRGEFGARVMAECSAKRRIVEIHYNGGGDNFPVTNSGFCSCCTSLPDGLDNPGWPCPTLRALAAVYADHPDYDEGWKP